MNIVKEVLSKVLVIVFSSIIVILIVSTIIYFVVKFIISTGVIPSTINDISKDTADKFSDNIFKKLFG